MMTMILALTLVGECPCGPGCPGPGLCPCGCVALHLAPLQELPTLEEGLRICRLTRRPICLWVGQTDRDIEAAFPEAIHAYAARIEGHPGPGVCVARWDGSDLTGWLYYGGRPPPAAALQVAAGCRLTAAAGSPAWPVATAGCWPGGCGPGGCGPGGCGRGR